MTCKSSEKLSLICRLKVDVVFINALGITISYLRFRKSCRFRNSQF